MDTLYTRILRRTAASSPSAGSRGTGFEPWTPPGGAAARGVWEDAYHFSWRTLGLERAEFVVAVDEDELASLVDVVVCMNELGDAS